MRHGERIQAVVVSCKSWCSEFWSWSYYFLDVMLVSSWPFSQRVCYFYYSISPMKSCHRWFSGSQEILDFVDRQITGHSSEFRMYIQKVPCQIHQYLKTSHESYIHALYFIIFSIFIEIKCSNVKFQGVVPVKWTYIFDLNTLDSYCYYLNHTQNLLDIHVYRNASDIRSMCCKYAGFMYIENRKFERDSNHAQNKLVNEKALLHHWKKVPQHDQFRWMHSPR